MNLLKHVIFLFGNFLYRLYPVRKECTAQIADINIYITLLKPLGIGDIIMLSPFLEVLARECKDGNVKVITEYKSFIELKGCEWIHPNNISIAELREAMVISPTLSFRHILYAVKARYFIGYFVSNRLMSNFVDVESEYDPKNRHYLERSKPIMEALKFPVSPLIYPKLRKAKIHPLDLPERYICVAPYSNWPARQYPSECYHELLSVLVADYKIVLIGSDDLDEVVFNTEITDNLDSDNIYNLTGKTSLQEMNAIIVASNVFIGNDSGPAHVACLEANKVIILFGCVRPQTRIPEAAAIQEKVISYSGGNKCNRYPCYDGYNMPRCTNNYICLYSIPVNKIIENVQRLMKSCD